MPEMSHCLICQHSSMEVLSALPIGVLSDGRVMSKPLAKQSCLNCGCATHVTPLTRHDIAAIYNEDYNLGTEQSTETDKRAADYARWISHICSRYPVPKTCLEIGCGNGALLEKLRNLWPDTVFIGVEPAEQAARIAQSKDIIIYNHMFEDIVHEISPGSIDLILSVNVIEHSLDPVRFLELQKMCLSDNGHILTICPDGDIPNLELMFYDHVTSLPKTALQIAGKRAGAGLETVYNAPQEIGHFHAALYRHNGSVSDIEAFKSQDLTKQRQHYLSRWAKLDTALRNTYDRNNVFIFGAGEMSFLLKGYAPNFWHCVSGLIVDHPPAEQLLGKEVHATDDVLKYKPDTQLLIAIRPDRVPLLTQVLAHKGFSHIDAITNYL